MKRPIYGMLIFSVSSLCLVAARADICPPTVAVVASCPGITATAKCSAYNVYEDPLKQTIDVNKTATKCNGKTYNQTISDFFKCDASSELYTYCYAVVVDDEEQTVECGYPWACGIDPETKRCVQTEDLNGNIVTGPLKSWGWCCTFPGADGNEYPDIYCWFATKVVRPPNEN
jgi:hypothetical protein